MDIMVYLSNNRLDNFGSRTLINGTVQEPGISGTLDHGGEK